MVQEQFVGIEAEGDVRTAAFVARDGDKQEEVRRRQVGV